MLTTYLTRVQNLLQLPAASPTLYPTAVLTDWINMARGQLAGEAECIRTVGTISTVPNQQAYNFSSINLGVAATTGIDGAINVQRLWYQVASGQRRINSRGWSWFAQYEYNNPVPQAGPPRVWSQYAQGSAPGHTGSGGGGSFYISMPDIVYTLLCDCTCYPIALADNTTVEAIPYLWTDAVPFLAAYYALLSAQTNARMADAERYYNYYETFVDRARRSANPSNHRWQYPQSQDVVQANKVAASKQAGGAA